MFYNIFNNFGWVLSIVTSIINPINVKLLEEQADISKWVNNWLESRIKGEEELSQKLQWTNVKHVRRKFLRKQNKPIQTESTQIWRVNIHTKGSLYF